MSKKVDKKNFAFADLLALSVDELKANLKQLRQLSMNFRFARPYGSTAQAHVIKANRRMIARILTAINIVRKNGN